MAYVIDKRITHTSESKADETKRIWTRWTEHGVSACRYCGAPMILHDPSYCRETRVQMSEEENCEQADNG